MGSRRFGHVLKGTEFSPFSQIVSEALLVRPLGELPIRKRKLFKLEKVKSEKDPLFKNYRHVRQSERIVKWLISSRRRLISSRELPLDRRGIGSYCLRVSS